MLIYGKSAFLVLILIIIKKYCIYLINLLGVPLLKVEARLEVYLKRNGKTANFSKKKMIFAAIPKVWVRMKEPYSKICFPPKLASKKIYRKEVSALLNQSQLPEQKRYFRK